MSSLRTFIPCFEITGTATAPIEAYDLTGFTDAPIDGVDKPVKGFALSPASPGMEFAAIVIGVHRVKAQGQITAGDRLVSFDAKRVRVAVDADKNVFATALTDAADGGFVDILIR